MASVDFSPFIIAMLFIALLNYNGLRNVDKLKNTDGLFSSVFTDFAYLHATFWDNDFVDKYKHLLFGELYCSNALDNGKGVAIVAAIKWKNKIIDSRRDNAGRIILITVDFDGQEFDIINCYAPNSSRDRVIFFNDLNGFIRINMSHIVAGDVNVVFSALDRATQILEYDKSRDKLFVVMT